MRFYRIQGHVNNVNYFRYAESARVNWITNFAVHADPAHRKQWSELMTPKSVGLIMRTLKCEFKFVSSSLPSPCLSLSPLRQLLPHTHRHETEQLTMESPPTYY